MRRELSVVPLFCFWFARLHLPLFPSSFPPLRRSGRGSRTNNCKAPPSPRPPLASDKHTFDGTQSACVRWKSKNQKVHFWTILENYFSLVQCRIAMNTSRHVLCSRTCISVVVSLFSFRGMQCLRCVVLSLSSPSSAPCQKSICAWPPAILTSLWRRREEEGVEMKRENIMRVGGLGWVGEAPSPS